MRQTVRGFRRNRPMKLKEKSMKNRMPAYFAGMAMFISVLAVVPGSVGAAGYRNANGISGVVPGPQINQPIGCARPAANTSSGSSTDGAVLTLNGGTTTMGTGTLTISGGNTYSGCSVINASMLTTSLDLSGFGGTLISGGTLGGTGSLQPITWDAGAILSVGNIPGIITIDDGLTFTGDLTFDGAINFDNALFLGTNLFWPPVMLCSNLYVMTDFWYSPCVTPFNDLRITYDFTGDFSVFDTSRLNLSRSRGSIDAGGTPFVLAGPVTDPSLGADSTGLITVIPEPASAIMLAFGAVAGMAVHRARRSAMRF